MNHLELRDHHDAVRVRGVDDVPRVDEAETDAAGDRRSDAAVVDVGRGGVDLTLVELDGPLVLLDERRLLVEHLLRDRILAPETLVAREVDLRLRQERLVARELPLGLQQLGLERARVDLGEQVAFPNDLAFGVEDSHQLPVHAGMDRVRVDGGDRAEPRQKDADVPLRGRRGLHRDGWGTGSARDRVRRVLWGAPSDDAERECDDRRGDDDSARPEPPCVHGITRRNRRAGAGASKPPEPPVGSAGVPTCRRRVSSRRQTAQPAVAATDACVKMRQEPCLVPAACSEKRVLR